MNTPVNFEISKLLKEKGCNIPSVLDYKTENNKTSVLIPSGMNAMGGFFSTYSAPTIAEVVMWLYKKHGIWIYAKRGYGWEFIIEKSETTYNDGTLNSPTEAYTEAILYTLNNLIQ